MVKVIPLFTVRFPLTKTVSTLHVVFEEMVPLVVIFDALAFSKIKAKQMARKSIAFQ
jgi:hypothetical protein